MDDGLNALWIKLFLFSKNTSRTSSSGTVLLPAFVHVWAVEVPVYFINIRSACSCARSDNDLDHGVGGGERHLRDKYGQVKALVFGHFGEFNDGLLKLADDISKSVAKQHHRMLGFKSGPGGARARRPASSTASRWSRSAPPRATCCGSPSYA